MRDTKAERRVLKLKRKRRLKQKRGADQKRRKKKEALKQKEREGWNREFFSIYFPSNLLKKNYGELVCVGFNF